MLDGINEPLLLDERTTTGPNVNQYWFVGVTTTGRALTSSGPYLPFSLWLAEAVFCGFVWWKRKLGVSLQAKSLESPLEK